MSWLFREGRLEVQERVIRGIEDQRRFLLDFLRSRGRAPAGPIPAPPVGPDAEILEARARLARYEEIGPIAPGVARRLRGASRRFPRAASAIKPLFRLARRATRRPV